MSQPPSYMENIPVKISEKYKPPPKITLPHHIYEKLKLNDILDPILDYDFSLERNILRKIDEWKKVRESEQENRRERMRKYEENRVRELEEKQKRLLTAVTYPSTDDLSSEEDEEAAGFSLPSSANAVAMTEKATEAIKPSITERMECADDGNIANNSEKENASTIATSNIEKSSPSTVGNEVQYNKNIVQFSPSHNQNFDTILTPTIVPDALHDIADYTSKNNIKSNNTVASKINYSDFENDTSSPFDNIELKTINDLDILAQVLNITQIHSIKDSSLPANAISINNSAATIEKSNGTTAAAQETKTVSTITTNLNVIDSKNLNDNANYGNLNQTDDSNVHNNPGNLIGINHTSHHSQVSNANSFYPSYDNTQTVTQQQPLGVSGVNAYNYMNMNEIIVRGHDFYNFYNNLPNNQNYDNYVYNNYNNAMQHYQQPQQHCEQTILDYRNYSSNYDHHDQQNLHQQQHQQTPNSIDFSNNAVTRNFHHQNVNVENNQSIFHHDATLSHDTLTIPNRNSINFNKSKSVPDILKELNDELSASEMRRKKFEEMENYESSRSKF